MGEEREQLLGPRAPLVVGERELGPSASAGSAFPRKREGGPSRVGGPGRAGSALPVLDKSSTRCTSHREAAMPKKRIIGLDQQMAGALGQHTLLAAAFCCLFLLATCCCCCQRRQATPSPGPRTASTKLPHIPAAAMPPSLASNGMLPTVPPPGATVL